MIIWKPLGGDCLRCVKESTNKVGKNAIVVVRTNSHCKEATEYLHDCINVSIPGSLRFGHLCKWETGQQ